MTPAAPPAEVPYDPETIPIVLVVQVLRHGHDRHLVGWAWKSAPAHVQRWIDGGFAEVTGELATNGYSFAVETVDEDVSLLDFLARSGRPRTGELA